MLAYEGRVGSSGVFLRWFIRIDEDREIVGMDQD